MENFRELVLGNRSYRRFDASVPVSEDTLMELVDLARRTPSAANRQPTRYHISYTTEECNKIFSTLKWAGYLSDWDGPIPTERPTGYITLLTEKDSPSSAVDEGIICQTILLGARALGLGGCILGNIDRTQLNYFLNLDNQYNISLVIALGVPVENVELTDIHLGEDFKYYRTPDQTHIVPKYSLEDVIV